MAARSILMAVGTALTLGLAGAGYLYGEELKFRLFDDPALRLCDTATRAAMKAPSTYRRIEALLAPDGREAWIEFDAQNSFGVSMRGASRCRFEFRPDTLPRLPGRFAITSMEVEGRELDRLAFITATMGVGTLAQADTALKP